MIDPVLKQVLCPGSESAPKKAAPAMLKQSDEVIRARRAKFLPESPPKGHKVPNYRQASLKKEGSFRPERTGNGIF